MGGGGERAVQGTDTHFSEVVWVSWTQVSGTAVALPPACEEGEQDSLFSKVSKSFTLPLFSHSYIPFTAIMDQTGLTLRARGQDWWTPADGYVQLLFLAQKTVFYQLRPWTSVLLTTLQPQGNVKLTIYPLVALS